MTEYALIDTGTSQILKKRTAAFANGVPDVTHKGWKWLPVNEDPQPTFNDEIQTVSSSETVFVNEVVRSWTVTDKDLTQIKDYLKKRVDRDAETERLKYITAGDGQAQEYQEALRQAEGYLADSAFQPTDLLQASVGAGEAADIAAAAALVKGRYDAWRAIGASIRQKRIKAKRDIDAAANVTAAWAIYEALDYGA